MKRFEPGDRIRIDIPDQADLDHERLHGRFGTVVKIIEDDAGHHTADPRDAYLFEVELDDGTIRDLRWRDLRPAPDE